MPQLRYFADGERLAIRNNAEWWPRVGDGITPTTFFNHEVGDEYDSFVVVSAVWITQNQIDIYLEEDLR